jgi:hypothetical protein
MNHMASFERNITDAFQVVFPKAKDGPAGEFLRDEERSDKALSMALVLSEYALLSRHNQNPYRMDLAEAMAEAEFFEGTSDVELDGTRGMLVMLQAMRKAVKAPVVVPEAEKKDG